MIPRPHMVFSGGPAMSTTEIKRKVVLVDWDNTLRRSYTVLAWTEFLAGRGLFSTRHAIIEGWDHFHADKSYKYEVFCRDMADAYAAGLAGKTREAVLAAAAAFVEADMENIFRFVRPLCELFAEQHMAVIVISGAPEVPLAQYASALGLEIGGALCLESQEGRYTGRWLDNCGLSASKQDAVARVSASSDVVMAFGDSDSDMPLLAAAQFRFLVRGATHDSVPNVPSLCEFESDSDPSVVLAIVRQCLNLVDPS
jgi:phosphoserine phosphatase